MVTIGDAISLVEFVQDLAEKLQARADKIDGWSSSTLFKNLELKVNACEKAVAALPEKDAGTQGFIEEVKDSLLEVKNKTTILVEQCKASKAPTFLFGLFMRKTVRALADAEGDLEKSIATASEVVDKLHGATTLDLMRRLAEANEEINKGGSAARFLELLASLRTQYDLVAEPEMEFLRAQKVVMGDRYPEAMFLAPKLVDDNTVAQMLGAMRVLWGFWKRVQDSYKHGILTDTNFFTTENRAWTGKGRAYRMLVEPLDIANWYMKENNLEFGHYADGILDELKDDNRKRPGRYLLLQQQEFRVYGSAESSLGKAHQLKALLGNRSWKQLPLGNSLGSNWVNCRQQ